MSILIPAEVIMEKPNLDNNLNWCWTVYQPNIPGQPEYVSGKHWDKEKAAAAARAALRVIHRQQGIIE